MGGNDVGNGGRDLGEGGGGEKEDPDGAFRKKRQVVMIETSHALSCGETFPLSKNWRGTSEIVAVEFSCSTDSASSDSVTGCSVFFFPSFFPAKGFF